MWISLRPREGYVQLVARIVDPVHEAEGTLGEEIASDQDLLTSAVDFKALGVDSYQSLRAFAEEHGGVELDERGHPIRPKAFA